VSVTDNRWHDMHAGSDPAMAACVEVVFGALLTVTPCRRPRVIGTSSRGRHRRRRREGTLAHDVRNIRELANANRDQLSIDTWSVLSDLEQGIAPFSTVPAVTSSAAMTALREALLAFAGLAAESMVRDAGWHFMDAGRRLERAVQIARLLRAGLTVQRRPGRRGAGRGIDADRRREHHHAPAPIPGPVRRGDHARAAPTRRDNRGLSPYQLDRLGPTCDASVTRPTRSKPRCRTSRPGCSGDCEALARSDETGRRAQLDELLGDIVDELHDLAGAVEAAHFAHRGMLRQLMPMAGFESLEAV